MISLVSQAGTVLMKLNASRFHRTAAGSALASEAMGVIRYATHVFDTRKGGERAHYYFFPHPP